MTVKPRPTKTSSISRRVCGDQVQAPDRLRRVAGQRDVDAVGDQPRVELGGVERASRGARSASSSARADLVGALADRAALLGRQLPTPRSRLGSSALRPEVPDAQLLERGGGRRPASISATASSWIVSMRSSIRRGTLFHSYSASVAAIAAFSDSLSIGMWAARVAGGDDVVGQARRARRRRPARPRRRAGPRSGSPAPRVQRDAHARAARRPMRHARDRHLEDRAHRRAHRLGRVRVGGARGRSRRTPRRRPARRAAPCRRCRGP